MYSPGARKNVAFVVFLSQVGRGYLRTEWPVRLFEAGDFGGGVGLISLLMCRSCDAA